jgi:hypothetical protein
LVVPVVIGAHCSYQFINDTQSKTDLESPAATTMVEQVAG